MHENRALGYSSDPKGGGWLGKPVSQVPTAGRGHGNRPETACAMGRRLGLGGAAAARVLSLNHFEDRNSRAPQVSARRAPKHEITRPRFRLAPAVSCKPTDRDYAQINTDTYPNPHSPPPPQRGRKRANEALTGSKASD